jgi:hypothetical protein
MGGRLDVRRQGRRAGKRRLSRPGEFVDAWHHDRAQHDQGLLPLPATIDHIVDVTQRCQGDGRGYDNLGARTIRGCVLHRSQGTWNSNISTFDSFCPGALTDLQVDNTDGRMMRFVRLPRPGQSAQAPSGWANGVVFRETLGYGDGRAFINRYGLDGVNRDLESCEITDRVFQAAGKRNHVG